MTRRTVKTPAPILPPNHCSHVVRFYEHSAKTCDNTKQLHDYSILPSILLGYRANAYAVCMVLPGRFNVI
jgi:hypothetical protein